MIKNLQILARVKKMKKKSNQDVIGQIKSIAKDDVYSKILKKTANKGSAP